MRRASKIDENHREICRALFESGCSVQTLAGVGSGVPDIMVGKAGVNYLLEIKDGNKPPSKRRLTDAQIEWHDSWRGQVTVVKDVDEALIAVGLKIGEQNGKEKCNGDT